MRQIYFIFIILTFTLQAQNTPKAALTAGSESLSSNSNEQKKSITEQTIVYSEEYYNAPPKESFIQQGTDRTALTSKKSSKEVVILLAGVLIAIAIYFITVKNKQTANLATTQKIETEDEAILKKQMWDQLAIADEDEPKEKA